MSQVIESDAPADPRPTGAGNGQGSFEEFYAAANRGLTLQLYAYLGDFGEAEDVVQEAFCRALARWNTLGGYEDPTAWVRRVAWNLGTSRFRRMRTAGQFLRRQREARVDGPDVNRIALTRALAAIPAPQRRAVVLHYMAQLSVQEIADQEGVAPGTVKSWLSRGRAALATQLVDGSTQPGGVDANQVISGEGRNV